MTVAIVAGALANKPGNGGAAWTRLSWILGMRGLGFTVHFVEQVAGDGAGLHWAREVLAGFDVPATFVRADGTVVHALDGGSQPDTDLSAGAQSLEERIADAAVLVNLSGNLAVPALRDRAAVRVYVDLDPGYTQLWHAQGLLDLSGHTHYATVGLRVGGDGCTLPTGGLDWLPVLQPLLLDQWPVAPIPDRPRFTTVAAWRGPYGTVEHAGRSLGPKAHEFRRFLPLPERAPGPFELAVDIHPADAGDRAALSHHGWLLADPGAVAGDPQAFRRYVRGSAAECSVAQGMYVETGTGWFSDRTTRYLGSGRPALVQDTGFADILPTGDGLVAFTTLDEAAQGARRILADEAHHAAAARQLAEEHFASDVVLGRLCEEVGVAP